MSNALYDNYLNLILGSGSAAHTFCDMDSDTIKVLLVDSADYTPNLATHQDHADVTGAGIVSTATLASKTAGTVGAGVFDAADTTFTSVSGDQSELLVIYKDSGTSNTSPLVAKFDTFSSGMPVTPNGGDIIVTWNASGIFKIG